MAEEGFDAPSGECNLLSEKSDGSNSLFPEDTSKWLAALESYVRLTQTTCLELQPKQIGVKEAPAIYKFLTDSHVTDLKICCGNILTGGIEDLLQLLVTSKIETLWVCRCIGSIKELLRLLEALKNTRITELTINHEHCKVYPRRSFSDVLEGTIEFDPDEKEELISHLLDSHLTKFDFQFFRFVWSLGEEPLIQVMHNTSLTNLDLAYTRFAFVDSSLLFSALRDSAITDLKLSNTGLDEDGLQHLSLNLRDSKVVSLNLARNNITDAGLDILAVGLVHSAVRSLDISQNSISGSSCFGLCLKDSQISHLNMSLNTITSEKLLFFPQALRHSSIVSLNVMLCGLGDALGRQLIKSLKHSKVTHVNLSWNDLKSFSIEKLTSVLKDTVLTHIDVSYNGFPSDRVATLADCLNGSVLKDIKLNNRMFAGYLDLEPAALGLFLERTIGTSITSVDFHSNELDVDGVKTIAGSLANTTFTSLNLSCNSVKSSIIFLAPQLKFTAITHLDLGRNELGDTGVETLANCLADTKITHPDVCCNSITDRGVTFLAVRLKGTKLLHLDLSENKIKNEGFDILAKHAEGTFLLTLNTTKNPGVNSLLLDRVLLENQTSKHCLVKLFKQITPKSNSKSFRFDNSIDDEKVDVFLNECLLLYKKVLEQSSAAIILAAEDPCLSAEEIISLFQEFPTQFTMFVTNQIEASASQHVRLLKKAEDLELHNIVEVLLLNRPALMIDRNENILHPYVYRLMHKYKQPLYNTSIEPKGKTKIINYFTKHSDLKGASDILSILSGNFAAV